MFLIGNVASRMLANADSDFNSRPGITTFAEYSIVCNLLVIAGTVLFSMVVKRLVRALGAAGTSNTVPGGVA